LIFQSPRVISGKSDAICEKSRLISEVSRKICEKSPVIYGKSDAISGKSGSIHFPVSHHPAKPHARIRHCHALPGPRSAVVSTAGCGGVSPPAGTPRRDAG
jgi:hypothetical protein